MSKQPTVKLLNQQTKKINYFLQPTLQKTFSTTETQNSCITFKCVNYLSIYQVLRHNENRWKGFCPVVSQWLHTPRDGGLVLRNDTSKTLTLAQVMYLV